MSFLKTLKGFVVEDDAGVATPPGIPVTAPVANAVASSATFTPVSVLNTAMVEAIRKSTFSRNTALTALIAASDSLIDIIPDPTMRLRAAQKTAGAGRSAKDMVDAVAIHLNDIDSEALRFDKALTSKIQAEVGGLIQQAESIDSQINAANAEAAGLAERIQKLQEMVAASIGKAAELRHTASNKEVELRQAASDFKVAADAVRAELNQHKATILSTLG